jgi:predicted amidophosphoribosyltransferase
MEFETFVIIVAVALILVFATLSSGRRRALRSGQQRQCAACGAAHPPFAQFCRRCGQRLKE